VTERAQTARTHVNACALRARAEMFFAFAIVARGWSHDAAKEA